MGCLGNRCPPAAKSARLDALANADRATAFAIAGSVLVASGAALWLVGTPQNSVQVGATVANGSVEASLRGAIP